MLGGDEVMRSRAVFGGMGVIVGRVNRPFAAIGSGEDVFVPVAWSCRAVKPGVAGVILECGSGHGCCCFGVAHIVLLVGGAKLGRLVIKVNIFFQLIAFPFILSGFHGAVFPCKNVKNRSELQFNARYRPQSCGYAA
jgi:hypothetical protein